VSADKTPDATGPTRQDPTTPAWMTAPARALLLPLGGMLAVVLLVGMSMVWPVDAQVVTAAITATITMAAAAGGHAAGSARSRD
jgi:hypothetical protein